MYLVSISTINLANVRCHNKYTAGRKGFYSAYLVWLRLGPVLQSGKDAIVALDNPVLLDGEGLNLGCSNGHAKTDLQNPTTCSHENTTVQASLILFCWSDSKRSALCFFADDRL